MGRNLIRKLDLFAGAGGLTDGFLQTGKYFSTAAVEWEKPMVNTLQNRLETKWESFTNPNSTLHFDIQRDEELFQGWNNDEFYGTSEGLDYFVNKSAGIDMIIGGPPCQAYSVAGRVRDENGMREDYRNFLFENYLKVVMRYQPKMFVFENVPGMLSAKPGDKFVTDIIREDFEKAGYEIINDLKGNAIVNANDYGVAQNRNRVIIIGIRKDSVSNSIDLQKVLFEYYNNILPKYKVKVEYTVKDAIGELESFVPQDINHNSRKNVYIPKKNSGIQLSWHKPRYHSSRDMKIFKLLSDDLATGQNKYQNAEALTKLYEKVVGSKSTIHRYHVLRPNLPSTTIIAHLYKDGNRFIHYDPEQSRTITPREAARIQSFDDDYEFLGKQGSVYKMIGNAVPPKLAKAIGNSVYNLYEKLYN